MISGKAEPGSTALIQNVTENKQVANVPTDPLTGEYAALLTTPLLNKQKIEVNAVDSSNNTSPAFVLFASSKVALSQPTTAREIPSSIQADILIQAIAAFAPPGSSQTRSLVGYCNTSYPMLASHA